MGQSVDSSRDWYALRCALLLPEGPAPTAPPLPQLRAGAGRDSITLKVLCPAGSLLLTHSFLVHPLSFLFYLNYLPLVSALPSTLSLVFLIDFPPSPSRFTSILLHFIFFRRLPENRHINRAFSLYHMQDDLYNVELLQVVDVWLLIVLIILWNWVESKKCLKIRYLAKRLSSSVIFILILFKNLITLAFLPNLPEGSILKNTHLWASI